MEEVNISGWRIFLVEDHPIYREGLHLILSFSGIDCEIVAEACNVKQAVEWLDAHPQCVDLAILDYFLPDGTADKVIKAIRALSPKAKILVITGEVDRDEVRKNVKGKVDGFISKDVQSAELVKIVTSLMEGPTGNTPDKTLDLTQREIEIIRLCGQGKNTREIAKELYISHRTVERHKNNICNKLGLKTSAELLKFAVLHGLL